MGDPLELETRRRIYEYLQGKPGAHMREIGRELAVPMGTLEYHLHYLVKADLLTTRQDGRYTRYFATGELSRREKDVLAVLRQKVPRQIAAHLLLEPRSSHGQLLTKFDLSASTLSFHIKKLLKTGVAVQEKSGRENLYTIVEPDLIGRVLITHRVSFLDDVIDRFADVWLGMEARGDDDGDDEGAPRKGDDGSTGRGDAETRPDEDPLGGGSGVLMVFGGLLRRLATA